MLGRSAGLTDEEMMEMANNRSSTLFDEKDKLVLRYSEILTQENRVDDEMYGALERCFPQAELVELCMTVALAAFVNRVHATFHTDVDEETLLELGDAERSTLGR